MAFKLILSAKSEMAEAGWIKPTCQLIEAPFSRESLTKHAA